jgi:hypothetical protein
MPQRAQTAGSMERQEEDPMWKRWMVGLLAVVVTGCAGSTPVEPALDASAIKGGLPAPGAKTIAVMTQNLYVGADVDAVIAALTTASTDDDLPALVQAYLELVRTDFPARARRIADEIAKARPQVVAIQELSELDIDLLALYPDPLPIEIQYYVDFRTELLAALAARGLDYDLYDVTNIVVDVAPVPGATTVSLVDRDGLLVRGDLDVVDDGSGNYTLCLGTGPTCLGGPPFPILRGYVWADVVLGGMTVRVVGTHLESGTSVPTRYVRAAQAAELMQILGEVANPVLLMGDFNEEMGGAPNPSLGEGLPDLPATYDILTALGGFTDVWHAMRPGVSGLTCCHIADLSNRLPGFSERIDLVLARGFQWPRQSPQGRISIVAATPAAGFLNTDGLSIWPSDHAGLAAELLFPPAWAGTK